MHHLPASRVSLLLFSLKVPVFWDVTLRCGVFPTFERNVKSLQTGIVDMTSVETSKPSTREVFYSISVKKKVKVKFAL
jgi:hypothetical protein